MPQSPRRPAATPQCAVVFVASSTISTFSNGSPTSDGPRLREQEIESFFKRSHKVIVALTVKEILDEQIARKLA